MTLASSNKRPFPVATPSWLEEALTEGRVIVHPVEDAAEWWAGAPSACVDAEGVFWLACRMRWPRDPRGQRGYELRIYRSEDGETFEQVHAIHRDEAGVPGFERPALRIDPVAGTFRLYACAAWHDGPWSILRFDDAKRPDAFIPATARAVISPQRPAFEREVVIDGYKDPVITFANGQWHAYVIGYLRRHERIYHFVSGDGEQWEPAGPRQQSIMDLTGWHDFFVRPASVMHVGIGWLFAYEGSRATWHEPVYNIATGLAFTDDLHTMRDLTPDAPLLASPTPSERMACFRYSEWLVAKGALHIFAETGRPNEAHDLRLFTLPIDWLRKQWPA